MKKSTKRNIILTSLAAIAAAGSVVVGSTYALFTSESKANIAVTSGKVEVVATLGNLKTYSGVDLTGDPDTDKVEETETLGVFTNGGTAKIEENNLILDKLTPGDKVTFEIAIKNNSDVKIKYRTLVKSIEDNGLFAGLKVKIADDTFTGEVIESKWVKYNVGEGNQTIKVYVELPSDAGNEYQEKSCKLAYSVEAVQSNAKVAGITRVSSASEFQEAIAEGSDVDLVEDITLDEALTITGDLTVYGNGKTFNAPADKDNRVIQYNESSEDCSITLKDVKVDASTIERGLTFYGNTGKVEVVLDRCEVSADHYAVNVGYYNENIELVFKNSDIVGYAAFQTFSAGTKATFENCNLKGLNKWSGNDDDFGTICVNYDADDTVLSFKNCTIEAEEKGTAKEYFLDLRAKCDLTFDGCTFKKNGTEVELTSDDICVDGELAESDYTITVK